MGLFKTKKKHIVGVSNVRVIEDEMLPNMLLAATYEAVTQTNDISWSIKQAVLYGKYRQFDRMYRWAKQANKYYYGLPDTQILRSGEGTEAMAAHLETTYPNATVDYVRYRPLNHHHEAYRWLTEGSFNGVLVDYSHVTNLALGLSENAGYPIYIKSITAVYKTDSSVENQVEKGAADTWENTPVQFMRDQVKDGQFIPIDLSSFTFLRDTTQAPVYNIGLDEIVTPASEIANNLHFPVLFKEDGEEPSQLLIRFGDDEIDSFEIRFGWKTGGEWVPPLPIFPNLVDPANPPKYVRQTGESIYIEDLTIVSNKGINDLEYYQSRLTFGNNVVTQEPTRRYFTYNPLDGLIPSVDSIYVFANNAPYFTQGTYFPMLPFRLGATDLSVDPSEGGEGTQEQWDSCVKLGDFIGIDYASMGKSISNPDAEQGQDEDFDADTIEEAVMIMAVELQSQDKVDIDYLHMYFSDLWEVLPEKATNRTYNYAPENFDYRAADGGDMANTDEQFGIVISDGGYRTILSFDNLIVMQKPGVLVPRIINESADPEAELPPLVILPPYDEVTGVANHGTIGTLTNETVNPYSAPTWHTENPSTSSDQIIRRQITTQFYTEVRITNPAQRYDVWNGYSVISSGDDSRLLIMLDYNICQRISTFDKERLYGRSLNIVFTTHQVIKTKWYQQGWFKVVIFIIAIALILYNVPGGWQVLMAALAGTTAAIIIVVSHLIINLFLAYIISLAATALIEKIGVEAGIVLVVLVVAAAIATGYAPDGLVNSVLNMTAETLLVVSNGLIAGVQAVQQANILETLGKYEDLYALEEQRDDQLEAALALLDTNSGLASAEDYIGLQPLFVAGESPEDYINRLGHSGNVGAESLQIVENYVSVALRLPTLNDSYGALQK